MQLARKLATDLLWMGIVHLVKRDQVGTTIDYHERTFCDEQRRSYLDRFFGYHV